MRGLTEEQKVAIDQLRFSLSHRKIAKHLGVPKSTVWDYIKNNPMTKPSKLPKILLLDVETSPMIAFVWGRWKQNVGQDQVVQESNLLTYTAKWLGDTQALINAVSPEDTTDDYELTKDLRDLLDEADIVIAFNGIKFDIRVINTRILYHGIDQPSPYKVIDPMVTAKKCFRFSSNSMDAIAAYFGLNRKLKHAGFELWKRVMMGDEEAIEEMLDYNVQDVIVLEQVYLKLRAWEPSLPSLSAITGTNCCPCCGSTNMSETDKFYFTKVSKYPLTQCNDCGSFTRDRVNVLDRANMGVGV